MDKMKKSNVELLQEAQAHLESIKEEDIKALTPQELAEFEKSFNEFQAKMAELKTKIESK